MVDVFCFVLISVIIECLETKGCLINHIQTISQPARQPLLSSFFWCLTHQKKNEEHSGRVPQQREKIQCLSDQTLTKWISFTLVINYMSKLLVQVKKFSFSLSLSSLCFWVRRKRSIESSGLFEFNDIEKSFNIA